MTSRFVLYLLMSITFLCCKQRTEDAPSKEVLLDNSSKGKETRLNDEKNEENLNAHINLDSNRPGMSNQIQALTKSTGFHVDSIAYRDSVAKANKAMPLNNTVSLTPVQKKPTVNPSPNGSTNTRSNPKPIFPQKSQASTPKEEVEDFISIRMPQRSNQEPEKSSKQTSQDRVVDDRNLEINIPCLLVNKTKVLPGGTLSVITTEEAYIGNGTKLPAGTMITGYCEIAENRVLLSVRSLNVSGKIVNIYLRAYDLDGAEGINVPGATVKRNVSGGINNSVQSAGQVISGSGNGLGTTILGNVVRGATQNPGKSSVYVDGGKKLILRN